MKAMILENPAPIGQNPLEMADLPVPAPAADQILIKVLVCGACHTDLDLAEGRLQTAVSPVVPGHQVVGLVEDKGKNVARFRVGDRVGVTWLYWACGCCSHCRNHAENLCENAKWTGKDANGGYAEFMVISEHFAHHLPGIFSDTQAAPLLCAGVIGYRTLRLAQLTDGQNVGLYGFGASAHIVIQLIKHKYPSCRVFVFTKAPEHAALAIKLGAEWVGRSGDQPPVKLARIMDFTPVGRCVRDALQTLDRGGRLVINAIRKETPVPPLDYAKYLWLEREIKSVANVTRADAEQFLPLAAEIPIIPTVEEFPLHQANEVLGFIKHSSLKAAGVLRVSR
jgi:propanol-preferring alcohol dehydrogenase